RLLQVMIGWWLEQPPTSVGASLPRTFSQPLYDVLMVKRNEACGVTMFNVSWNVHSGVNASILGKIPVRQANAVKAKHHIPTVNA
ncbi:hypothetical protein MJI47_28135, partial [Salmonella enterica subsp. enterica serovar Kentucky]|nr:hypothetical protein [Salmonella enterica subsp. enterica serovar Kentucky]